MSFFTEFEKANDSENFKLYLKYRTQLFMFLWKNKVEISYVIFFFYWHKNASTGKCTKMHIYATFVKYT